MFMCLVLRFLASYLVLPVASFTQDLTAFMLSNVACNFIIVPITYCGHTQNYPLQITHFENLIVSTCGVDIFADVFLYMAGGLDLLGLQFP